MKTATVLLLSLLTLGALLPPEPKPTLCHWEIEAMFNGGPQDIGTLVRCHKVLIRKFNERSQRYAGSY